MRKAEKASERLRVYDQELGRGAAKASGYYLRKLWRFCERSDAVDGALQVKRPIYKQDRYGLWGLCVLGSGRVAWATHSNAVSS